MIPDIFIQLAVALGLGLLVGLQRERVDSVIAGIRTFALISLFGAVCAQLAKTYGGWILVVGFLATAVLITAGNLVRMQTREAEPGQTTEFAALVVFGLGAWVVTGSMAVPVVLAGAVVVLLHFREPIHNVVEKIGEKDLRAIMQFVLIALVILPVLPDRDMGPYGVLNPYQIWWMVVLIVGLSLAGYVVYKLFGSGAGTVLAGILGGLISSTATTATYARRSRGSPESSPDTARLAALVIMLASTVVYGRVLVEIAAVARGRLLDLAPPIAAMLGVCALIAGAAWLLGRDGNGEPPQPGNPAELKAALIFGALYAAVLLAVAFARDRFGTAGLYGVAAISGLTDVDAITLSTARLVQASKLDPDTGWRAILLASLSNLGFKAGIVAVLGSKALLGRIALLFGAAMAGGGLILWLWP
ncbi:MAG TPA: MgtC/SapB family protein [Thermoanaerobaculia bacterium]|nr:MgtC/SapB family protein [Thermoanaerobaculia bacterium]